MQMLYQNTTERRPTVNCSSESMNLVALTRFDAATVTHNAACLAAGPKPGRLSPPPTTTHWEAVQEMFSASRPRFVALAYSVLRNKEDAEDAVQDAMLSAYRYLRSFEGRSAVTTWFTRIVVNAALMIRRKRKPARIEAFPDSGDNDETSWIERIPAPEPDPEMVCAETETFRSIDQLLREMIPVLRQAFTMAYYDELSIEEAGTLLGVTPGTFKSRVFRARQYLVQQTQRSLVAPIGCATPHTVSFPQKSVRASGRRVRENPVSGCCVRMTGPASLNHLFRGLHAGT
jgi:RNA polymerase sigma-70 factor (ECF subfamily)